jgi:hypothetical protein
MQALPKGRPVILTGRFPRTYDTRLFLGGVYEPDWENWLGNWKCQGAWLRLADRRQNKQVSEPHILTNKMHNCVSLLAGAGWRRAYVVRPQQSPAERSGVFAVPL